LCGALALGACKKKLAPGLAALELSAPPAASAMPITLDIELGGAVELLGAKLSPAQGLKPGSRVELTLYWRRTASIDKGYRLFTHLIDEAGERVLNLDGVGLLRKASLGEPLLPPSAWDEGKVYVDQLAFWIPPSVRTDTVSIVCGLFRDDERLAITRGAQKGERVVVAKLPVQRPIAPSAGVVPVLWVPWRPAAAPVVIDGKLDEAAWLHAASTGPLVNVGTGEPASGREVSGNVKLLFDEQSLYVGFEVFDEDLRGGFDTNVPDPHLWLKDAVEIMVDPDGDGDNRDYYEIQVGPQNLVFDSAFDSYNLPHVDPDGPFGHEEWSANLKSAVTLQGTLDDDREDEGYVVELSIPWIAFGKAKRVPPSLGDIWRMNFYAIQNNGGVAWSPILGQGNFHKASRFGRVRFAAAPHAGGLPARVDQHAVVGAGAPTTTRRRPH
jgi:Carbohydrate family 9 binding domain-like